MNKKANNLKKIQLINHKIPQIQLWKFLYKLVLLLLQHPIKKVNFLISKKRINNSKIEMM